MPRRLLVVEDDETIRALLVEFFREHDDLSVDTARDGVEALNRVRTRDYDLILLDLVMPHMSGIDFLASLQALASDPSVRTIHCAPAVVVVTSIPCDDIPTGHIEDRFPTIVRGVLRKPVDFRALTEMALRAD